MARLREMEYGLDQAYRRHIKDVAPPSVISIRPFTVARPQMHQRVLSVEPKATDDRGQVELNSGQPS